MITNDATEKKPLWLLIEENILALDSQALSEKNLEATIQRLAVELDKTGYNVSGHGGNMIELRWAVKDTIKAGKPLMKDLNTALAAFTLADVADPYLATNKLLGDIGQTWPKLKGAKYRPIVIDFVEKTKLDLLITKAKGLDGDNGIRLLIKEKVDPGVIIDAFEITDEKLKQVNADIKKELAERARVAKLIAAVDGKPTEEKVKHLIQQTVSEELIIEMAKVDQGVIDAVKKAMEEELTAILGRKADMRTPRDLSRYFRDEVVRNAVVQYAA